ncbi:MAG TPA: OmpA family protein [Acidobacteriaceae bacterium]|nr:OmpA family protein [Acidobacteriaceae bacterium]
MKTRLNCGSFTVLLVAASLALPAVAQSTSDQQPQVQTGASTNAQAQAQTTNPETGTGKAPLPMKSNEGFWGKVNPFARKKWVNRQLDPVKDRLNELDQLQAKNANDIKDVDQRAQNGIRAAQSSADQANQVASAATTTAQQAQQTAQQASDKTNQLGETVANIDQYHPLTNTDIRFRPGQTVLNQKAKDALDQVVSQLQGQKGYVVEVAGYSRSRGTAGLQNSQHMAEAVVRYLAEKQIPVWRIHEVAMGNTPISTDDNSTAKPGSIVRVSLMANSLAALNQPSSGGSPIGATQQNSAQPSPQGAASQPTAQPQ